MWMDHVVDFLGYMFFSSLDFFSLYLLGFALFNLHPISYKKELFTAVFSSTLLSYVFVITNVYDIIPSFLITPAIVAIAFKILIVNKMNRIEEKKKKKWMYSIVISAICSFIYMAITSITVLLYVHYNYMELDNLSNSFSFETYLNQFSSSLIASSVAVFLIIRKGGFGFIFKKGEYKMFTIIAVILLLLNASVFYIFSSYEKTTPVLMLFAGLIIISTIIVLYLSYKQDDSEY